MNPSPEKQFPVRTGGPTISLKHIRISLRRVLLFTLVATLLLGGIGFWTYHAVRESVTDIYTAHLKTLLDADITALSIWMNNELFDVRSWAEEPDLRRRVNTLVEIGRDGPASRDRLVEHDSQQALNDKLEAVMLDRDHQGFAVIDRTGLVVGSSNRFPYLGKRIKADFMPALARVFDGEAVILKPHFKGDLISGLEAPKRQPIMMTGAPVRGESDDIIAVLVFTINPDQDFTRILSVARAGENADTYAFDRQGFLLSDSRFDDQLKAVGLLPDTPDARSILNVQIRDPGGDLTRGFRPQTPIGERPLTKMALSAVAGGEGLDIRGYRDYRGVRVIGAWKWLPEYDFGVATEVSAREAFAVLRPLQLAFSGLLLLLVLAAILILFSTLFIRRLQNRIEEVKKLGQYTLEEKIGEGGMGAVYKASHAMLKRPTAIKILKPDALNPESLARFEREVQLTSRLTHPNTIEIYDYGKTPDGIFYYAMEYLPGLTLTRLIELEVAVSPARVVHILKQICLSLKEAHGIGLIHRDIKPLNVILCERGGRYDWVKLLDFGLVKDMGNLDDVQLTADLEITGTPSYIAPERLADPLNIDARSDIYSLGAVGFNLLTGEDVFQGTTAVEICYHVMKTPPPRPSERIGPVPETLDQLILDCLAKAPDERPGSVDVIIEVLDGIGNAGRWSQADAMVWWTENADRIQGPGRAAQPASTVFGLR